MKIQTNLGALNTQRHLGISETDLNRSLQRLSSGYRINSAKDDAAGLSIAGKLRINAKSYVKASENTMQATAMVQVAEGAMDQIENIINRLKELATQAASANTDSDGRSRLNSEFSALVSEIDRIANATKYGDTYLIKGTFGATASTADLSAKGISGSSKIDVSNHIGSSTYTITDTATDTSTNTDTIKLTGKVGTTTVAQTLTVSATGAQTLNFDKLGVKITLDNTYDDDTELDGAEITITNSTQNIQVGTTESSDDRISITIGDMNKDQNYGGSNGLENWSVDTVTKAQNALASLDAAIDYVTEKRGDLGAIQNRLSYAAANLATTIENTLAAESTIRDVDMAAEMTSFTKNQILLQAGTAMLAQANLVPQQVLSLFS